MTNNPVPPGKPYVYAFSSARLVLLVCIVLGLMALSLMAGIRIERYQQSMKPTILEGVHGISPSVTAGPIEALPNTGAVTDEHPKVKPPSTEKAGTKVTASLKQPASAPSKPIPATVTQTTEHKLTEPAPKPVATPTPPEPKPQPQKPTPTPAKTEARKGHFAVQVSSSRDKATADSQVVLLRKKGFASYLEEIDLGAKGRFFRAMVGPFATRAEAKKIQDKLVKDSRFSDSYIRYLP